MKKALVLSVVLGLLASTASAQQGVAGTWLSASGVAQIKIGPCPDAANGPICGFVSNLINPKGPDGQVVAPDVANDYRNENPALRSRKVIGMPLIWGFKATSDPNTFEDGKIYNGEDGKTYSANISLQPDGKLRLRGYVGTPMFGQTQLWTRVN
ncbi:MAG: DUF2147 domain-containing protein [Alphaproteobacteria bacterium]|jgi:uncharacterized protein (DUF2147 family)|nr:DUF2147 domain-containing protein [Alphaproteobacteria bacterium]